MRFQLQFYFVVKKMDKKLIIATCIIAVQLHEDEQLLNQSKKRKKAHEIYEKRAKEGAFGTLFESYLSNDELFFHKYLRLPPQIFYELLHVLEPELVLERTNRVAQPISPAQQLCIALR